MRPIVLVAVLALSVQALPAVPAFHQCMGDANPPNDCMANAQALTTDLVDVWADSTNAGVEPDEPGVGPDNQNTLWYTFTAFRDSRGSFSVHDSQVQPTHAVYELQDDGTLVYLDGASGWSAMPWSWFPCVGGRVYYVQVGVEEGFGGGLMNLYGNPCQLHAEVPAAPSLSAATGAGVGEVALSWSVPDDGGSPILSYALARYASGCSGPSTLVATLDAATTSYVDAGLAQGRYHCYSIVATNDVGDGPDDIAAAPPRGVPSAVWNLRATNGPEQVSLAWAAPSVTGGATPAGYRIYLGDTLLGETASTSFVDGGLADGTTRTYTVHAVNAYGEGLPAVVAGRSWRAPDAPRSVDAGPDFPTGVEITWAAPLDDGGAPVTQYEILRGPKGGLMGPIGTAPASARSFHDSPPLVGGFDYAVVAWNARGPSPDSSRACGEQFPLPASLGGC